MKAFSIVIKIVVALAAVAGAIYIAATYGDRIVAWAKKLLGCGCCECDCDCECTCDGDCDECDAPQECCMEAAEEPAPATEGDFEG